MSAMFGWRRIGSLSKFFSSIVLEHDDWLALINLGACLTFVEVRVIIYLVIFNA